MTRTAIAIRHVPFEDLGILAPVLTERGYAIRYVDAGIDSVRDQSLEAADLLVVLGGPVGVGDAVRYPELADELRIIAERLERGAPLLGICLGAQLIAAALGAAVQPLGYAEIGYAPLRLTAEGRRGPLAVLGQTPVLHWHGDQFDIPRGATRLAATELTPNQAFAVGPSALALQFHLEADSTQIERWLIGHAHELATHGIDPRDLRRDAGEYGPALEARGREVFAAWLDRLDQGDVGESRFQRPT